MKNAAIVLMMSFATGLAATPQAALGEGDRVNQLMRLIPADIPTIVVIDDLESFDKALTPLIKAIKPDSSFPGLLTTMREQVPLGGWIDFTNPIGFGQIVIDQPDAYLVWAAIPDFAAMAKAVDGAAEEGGVWHIPFEDQDVYAKALGDYVVATTTKKHLSRSRVENRSLADGGTARFNLLRRQNALIHLDVDAIRAASESNLADWATQLPASVSNMLNQNTGADPRVLAGLIGALLDGVLELTRQLDAIDIGVACDDQLARATIAVTFEDGPIKTYLTKQKTPTVDLLSGMAARPFMYAFGYHFPGQASPFFDYVSAKVSHAVRFPEGEDTPPTGSAATEALLQATQVTRDFYRRIEGMTMIMTGSPDGLVTTGDYFGKDTKAILSAAKTLTVTPGSFLRPLAAAVPYEGLVSRQVGDVIVEQFRPTIEATNAQEKSAARKRFGANPRKAFGIAGDRVRHYVGNAGSLNDAFTGPSSERLASMPTVKQALEQLPDTPNVILLVDPIGGFRMYMQLVRGSQRRPNVPRPAVGISMSFATEPARVDICVPIRTIAGISQTIAGMRPVQAEPQPAPEAQPD